MNQELSKPKPSELKKQEAASRLMCTLCARTKVGSYHKEHVCPVHYGACPYCGQHDMIIHWNDLNWQKELDSLGRQKV